MRVTIHFHLYVCLIVAYAFALGYSAVLLNFDFTKIHLLTSTQNAHCMVPYRLFARMLALSLSLSFVRDDEVGEIKRKLRIKVCACFARAGHIKFCQNQIDRSASTSVCLLTIF